MEGSRGEGGDGDLREEKAEVGREGEKLGGR
jgi:hypothetical protein